MDRLDITLLALYWFPSRFFAGRLSARRSKPALALFRVRVPLVAPPTAD